MALTGLIGVGILGAGMVFAACVAAVRVLVPRWCPACDGRGKVGAIGRVVNCDLCHGSGRYRVPDTPPAEWFGPSG